MEVSGSTNLETQAAIASPLTPGDDFVYAISHDLRGPLLNFQGFLRRLSAACQSLESQAEKWNLTLDQRQQWNQLLGTKVWPSLEVLERSARRMDRLLAVLLELSRAGREPVCFARVATGQLVREAVEEFRAAALEKNVVLKMEPLPDLWADPERLRQIFRHLLSNALKFLSPDRTGQILLGGRANGHEVIFWVQDNGIGIRPDDRDRIFLPFGRVQEIEAPGNGIGLASVRKLMGQKGGRAWVESTHRQGSTFYIAFPAEPALTQA